MNEQFRSFEKPFVEQSNVHYNILFNIQKRY